MNRREFMRGTVALPFAALVPPANATQAIDHALLVAAEKAANPLMVVSGSIRSDIDIYHGGITWVDE